MGTRSQGLFEESQRYFPGGVNSPVRAYGAVGGTPPFMARGSGSKVYDADGKEYIDYVGSWGPLILGHAHAGVVAAVQETAARGTSFGAPTELELTLGRLVVAAMPAIEMLRFVNSGTEACMSAIRAARAFTHRDKIIKFDGCYHGHSDGLLVKAGSGGATLGVPDSGGVPAAYAGLTMVAPYNELGGVERLLLSNREEVAAIIVEPIAANMGVVPPAPRFLAGLRELADAFGALLIFDEVITGFRVSLGGAQGLFGIKPDLTCLGKIIGGGLPVAAYGGRREIMQMVAPIGAAYQAGTLSGNPLAMSAGIATLSVLQREGLYAELEEKGRLLEEGFREAARVAERQVTIARIGSLLTLFFAPGRVVDYTTAAQTDRRAFARYFNKMLSHGVYLPPSQFEALFISAAHSEEDISATVAAAHDSLRW